MVVSANFCTHKARKPYIDKAVNSIIDQVDIVRVHYNDYEPPEREWEQYTGEDLTDKGKFAHIQRGEIAFTCDDDILYSPNYVSETLRMLYEYEGVVTYHGRQLQGKGLDYYRDHKVFHFMHEVTEDVNVDIPGSGVCAFDTREFMPDILQYPQNKMADILLGLEAKRAGVPITCLSHPQQWFTIITNTNSIAAEMSRGCEEQNEFVDRFYY